MVYSKVKKYVKKGVKNTWALAKANPTATANKALSMAKYLHGIINSELKSILLHNALQTVDFNGVTIHLSDVQQGDLHNQRNGMSILARYLQFNISIGLPTSGLDECNGKLIIFYDKEKNYGTSNVPPTELFELAGARNGYLSYTPVNNRNRFQYITSKRFSLSANGKRSTVIHVNKKIFKHVKWEYNSQDRLENHIYAVLITDTSSGATDKPLFDYTHKLKFYDN